ncbi:MAG: TonB-dependent receptor [Ignavibacteriae bacterium]|nr:TonB-dependent receptor [Ignavibacteriota bacterium]
MKIIILLFLFLLTAKIFAQNNLTGIVTDTTGKPISHCTIYIHDLKRSAGTNIEGKYILKNLPEGTFLVEFRYIGYIKHSELINIKGDTKLDAQLNEEVVELHEVVVTGASGSNMINENPLPLSSIDENVLKESSSTNIIDAISREPGISQVTSGAAISKPIIRGLGFNRVVVINDGIRQEGQQWGDEHGIEIDENSVDHVELLKGPGSLMYGSDAIAGVINLIPSSPLPEGEIKSDIMLNFQTNNDLLNGKISNEGNIDNFIWSIRAGGKVAGNYQNGYDGRVFNSGFNELDMDGRFGVNGKWGYTHFNISFFKLNVGMIEGTRDSLGKFTREIVNSSETVEKKVGNEELKSYELFIPMQNIRHYGISNNTRLYFDNSIMELNIGIQQNNRKEFADPLNEHIPGLNMKLNSFMYTAKYMLNMNSGWMPTLGISGMFQSNKNLGYEVLVPAYNLFDIGGYFLIEKDFEKLNLSFGLRYDNRNIHSSGLYLNPDSTYTEKPTATVKFEPFENNFNGFSGSAGVSYKFNEYFSTKINLSRGFRSPNIAELGSNGVHEGTFRYEIGNNTLKPEFSSQIDLGFDYNIEHLSARLSLFYNNIENYIYIEKLNNYLLNDSVPDPINPVPAYHFVQGNSFLFGGELNIDIHPHPLDWLHFENSFSIVKANQSGKPDSIKYLPLIPAPRLLSQLRISNFQFSIENFQIKEGFAFIEGDYHFAQNEFFKAYNTETATLDYLIFNAGIGGTIANQSGKKIIKIFITLNNILDKSYQDHLSRLKYAELNIVTGRNGVFNMGRNLSVKVNYEF